VANTQGVFRNGAVGFIDWLDGFRMSGDKPLNDTYSC